MQKFHHMSSSSLMGIMYPLSFQYQDKNIHQNSLNHIKEIDTYIENEARIRIGDVNILIYKNAFSDKSSQVKFHNQIKLNIKLLSNDKTLDVEEKISKLVLYKQSFFSDNAIESLISSFNFTHNKKSKNK